MKLSHPEYTRALGHTMHTINHLRTGDLMTREDLKETNPNKQVPAINDNGFCLAERSVSFLSLFFPSLFFIQCLVLTCACSAAIMTYLVRKYKLPDHWYPSDLQKRAKIDEYLHWHHMFLRRGAAHTVFQKVYSVGTLQGSGYIHETEY